MPIYEYACKKCGSFEIMQRISEEPLKKCPTCGTKVSKLISRSAFHLKGSGWYMTDYGKNGPSDNKAEDSKPSTEAKEKDASSSSSTAKEKGASTSSPSPSAKDSGSKASAEAA